MPLSEVFAEFRLLGGELAGQVLSTAWLGDPEAVLDVIVEHRAS